MLGWLKALFSDADTDKPETDDDLWNAMESMDPRNSLVRLRQLNLSAEQFPIVKGLVEGTLTPAERPGVAGWCQAQEVSPTGLDALTRALQIVLESRGTTYVFPKGTKVPVAMLPRFVSTTGLCLIMSHCGGSPIAITSLEEFLASNGIAEYSTDVMAPSQAARRMTGKPSFVRLQRDRGEKPSITIEKRADDEKRLLEPIDITELVDEVNTTLGWNVTANELTLEGHIDQLGLHTCVVQVDSITKKKIGVWVVPKLAVSE